MDNDGALRQRGIRYIRLYSIGFKSLFFFCLFKGLVNSRKHINDQHPHLIVSVKCFFCVPHEKPLSDANIITATPCR